MPDLSLVRLVKLPPCGDLIAKTSRCFLKPIVEVVAAVIRRADGRLLISLRPDGADQGGLWEFPGGKRERKEGRIEALRRELREELGIEIGEPLPLLRLRYEYPTKIVDLDVWEVLRWNGTERGCEGQRIAWVSLDELNSYNFPAANRTIVLAAQLPRALITLPADFQPTVNSLERITAWREMGIGCLASGSYDFYAEQHAAGDRSVENSIVRLESAEKMRHLAPNLFTKPADAIARGGKAGSTAVVCCTISELHWIERHSMGLGVVDKTSWKIKHRNEVATDWDRVLELVVQLTTPMYLETGDLADITEAVSGGFQGIILDSVYWDKDPHITARDLVESMGRVCIA